MEAEPFVAARVAICLGCAERKGLGRVGSSVIVVRCCAATRCEGGRSLTAAGQECPLGKWASEQVTGK